MENVKFKKENLPIVLILILSAVLNLANLTIEGYGNEYYAAGVKSMLVNFKNFFFVSFDPAGFVSIDKPPLGFWIQTISAKIFGFSGWSIILPQALAGVISVGLIYYIVKRSFGNIAGTISALCLAITPVFVAASRNNTIDNLLVMVLLIACVFLSKAAEKGRVKYLMISLVFIGIGFNIKMLEAYMIIPAIYITYLISSAVPMKQRIKHLALGTVVLLVVSLSWAVIVDFVPAQYRPYVGSSTNNTVMELIVGHNGLERFNNSMGGRQRRGEFRSGNVYGTQNQRGSGNAQNGNWANGQNTAWGSQNRNMTNFPGGNGNIPEGMKLPEGSSGGRSPQGGGMAGNFGGQTEASITRLFSKNVLSDQIVWFLPLAIFGFIAGAIVEKLKFTFDNRKKLDLILWIFWLAPEFLYFSYTKGLFHQYYLTMMAPPIAALSGIGLVSMWKLYKEKSKNITWLLLPVSLVANGLVQLLMLSYYSNISSAIKTVIVSSLILCFSASVLLIIYKAVKKDNLEQVGNIKFGKALTALAFTGILITPAIGSAAAVNHKMNGTMPSAGLELLSNSESGNFMMGGRGSEGSNNEKLIKFLESNIKDEKYILVVSSATSAQDIILQTGKGVMALGGFTGSDKILTLDEFKAMVKNGEVRYVLTGGMGRGSMDDIMNWVEKNGKAVSESKWKNIVESRNKKEDTNSKPNSYDKNTTSKYYYENSNIGNNRSNNSNGGFDGMNSQVLYDLKGSVK